MAKSQQTFSKREKEKKRQKKREEKLKKKEARKAEAKEGDGGIPFAYVDKFGNLTDAPPEPSDKDEIDASEIVLGIPQKVEEEFDPIRNGKVAFFDHSKGFGFIMDIETQEKHFVHVSGLNDEINENDKVTFELEKGQKGMNAVRVNLQK
ncbi:cold-shock protein [Allomuricauda sp. SCSIO 65647]|uniref:cold-shock protein n=1 Tax=Allomuricauda sp. SCSIO 65647 TaxID=2908843 RepID=UPI001F2FE4CE|nr:cold shock domain-containing protein [Muricauda sp. SCSIO 65647]UJH67375.1 cold shock domain-containing protein [Muricauda sp. SCSIO 65647]